MSQVSAVVHISTPGCDTSEATPLALEFWKRVFREKVGEDKIEEVDTVAGWGCLNQYWLAVECEVETSWGWCRPVCLDADEWDVLFGALARGHLIMMVHYRTESGELEPHC